MTKACLPLVVVLLALLQTVVGQENVSSDIAAAVVEVSNGRPFHIENPLHLPFDRPYPKELTLKAAVLTNTVPLAYYDENTTANELFAPYRGFQPDLMRAMVQIAKRIDNVTLTWDLEQAKAFSYRKQFEWVANDCNSTVNPRGGFPLEECNRLDIVIGDYYGTPQRSNRTMLTPPLLTTAAATVQYVDRKRRPITTLREAAAIQEPVCLLEESYFDKQTEERFPGLIVADCFTHDECLQMLKNESCALFVEDELQLKYLAVQDADLRVTRETFMERYIVWPLNARLDPFVQQLIIRWIYEAKVTGVLDELHDKYFSFDFCPLGTAGTDCDKPCSTSHGMSDRYGNCVCESTKWTGDDCSILVQEDRNQIPTELRIISFVMVAINFAVCAACGLWLFIQRNTSQVQVSQPIFLSLILLGCIISTSTIFALAQEDTNGADPDAACMAIPWLYSVGFSITFGTLFAKIRRVFMLFRAAEKAAEDVQTTIITTQETFSIVTGILLLDVTILLTWTFVDPLQWQRTIIAQDKYGEPLASEGYCHSDHWIIFTMIIAALHLGLMLLATYMCIMSRNIPTQFHEGRYLSIAMVSNLQIFVIGVPVLVIVGADPQTSFFVRSAIIWMNDLVVVTVIFGNIMWSHYKEARIERRQRAADVEQHKIDIQNRTAREGTKTLVSNMLLQS